MYEDDEAGEFRLSRRKRSLVKLIAVTGSIEQGENALNDVICRGISRGMLSTSPYLLESFAM